MLFRSSSFPKTWKMPPPFEMFRHDMPADYMMLDAFCSTSECVIEEEEEEEESEDEPMSSVEDSDGGLEEENNDTEESVEGIDAYAVPEQDNNSEYEASAEDSDSMSEFSAPESDSSNDESLGAERSVIFSDEEDSNETLPLNVNSSGNELETEE